MALKRRNDPETVMLSGDPLNRALQALDVAREQILRGQEEAAIGFSRVRTADAAEAEREAGEESGAADRQRLAERPIYRPA
jgi:hypothetical protein